jgi:hypothetical protein
MHVFKVEVGQLERELGFGRARNCPKVVASLIEHLVGPLLGRTWGGQEQRDKQTWGMAAIHGAIDQMTSKAYASEK